MAPSARRTLALVAAVAAVGALWAATRRPPRPTPAPPPASGSVSAGDRALAHLAAELAVGDVVEGWAVRGISSGRDGLGRIELERGGKRFSVFVGRRADHGGHPPPIQTERYDIGFGDVVATGAPPDETEMRAVAGSIADRVRQREAVAPVPEGL
jgi:hypothetical protein